MLRAFDKIAELDGEFFKQFFTEVAPEPETIPDAGFSDDGVIDLVAAEAATEEIKRQPAPPKEKPKWMNLPLRPIDGDSAIATVDLASEIGDRARPSLRNGRQSRGDERAELRHHARTLVTGSTLNCCGSPLTTSGCPTASVERCVTRSGTGSPKDEGHASRRSPPLKLCRKSDYQS